LTESIGGCGRDACEGGKEQYQWMITGLANSLSVLHIQRFQEQVDRKTYSGLSQYHAGRKCRGQNGQFTTGTELSSFRVDPGIGFRGIRGPGKLLRGTIKQS